MTAKEKAEELVEKIIKNGYVLNRFNAKQCAIIAVNEILNITLSYAGKDYEFWQEVKIEIQEL